MPTDPTLPLLQVCAELGLLALRDLFVELALLAGDRAFTSAEVVAHAALPENHRLRAAIQRLCGAEYAAGKLGKLFAKWAGVDIVGIVITAIGADANAVLWAVKVNPERTAPASSGNIVALPPTLEKAHAR